MSALGLSAADQKLSRDDRRKKKEVEEARMAGTLPPEMDNDGNLINPHIPEYMSKAPWYLNQEQGAGLKHQKAIVTPTYDTLNATVKRGFAAPAARKYRKGACRNCGAMSHKTKECVYRPRKVGAWKTNDDIQPDEVKPTELALTYDGKRDRWNGYDPEQHKQTIERFEFLRKERRRRKIAKKDERFAANARKAPKNLSTYNKLFSGKDDPKGKGQGDKDKEDDDDEDTDTDTDTDIDSDSDTDSDADSDDEDEVRQHDTQEELIGQKMMRIGTGSKSTVRNLRIREDLPKYLRNLDVNSAFYAPKTRSMRENPTPNAGPEDSVYMGDNWARVSGDSKKMAQTQIHAWEAYRQGADVNMIADPTTVELLEKNTKLRREQLKKKQKDSLIKKYDPDRKHMHKPDKSLLLGETEQYNLYRADGTLQKGGQTESKTVTKSKYEEDVYPLNHTSVWGSWFNKETMSWGFQCCFQCSATSYCTGDAGKEAHKQSVLNKRKALEDLAAKNAAAAAEEEAAPPGGETKSTLVSMNSDLYGEAKPTELDPEKLKVAMAKAKEKVKKDAKKEAARKAGKGKGKGKGDTSSSDDEDGDGDGDGSGNGNGFASRGKRKYNSMAEQTVSAEDMEAWRATRARADDPMANFNADEAEGGVAGDSDDDLMAADKAHKLAMEEMAAKKKKGNDEKKHNKKKKKKEKKSKKGSHKSKKKRKKRSRSSSNSNTDSS